MKKKYKIVTGVIAVLLVFTIPLGIFYTVQLFSSDDSGYYRETWGIALPEHMEIEYSINNIGFPSDGTAYSVRTLKDTDALTMDLNDSKDPGMEAEVNALLATLDIPADRLPDWRQAYQWDMYQNQVFDSLYVIYFPASNTLSLIKSLS